MDAILSAYVGALMTYIQMEYDNLPQQITPEMEEYFVSCFNYEICLPNAAGGFWEKFLKTPETI